MVRWKIWGLLASCALAGTLVSGSIEESLQEKDLPSINRPYLDLESYSSYKGQSNPTSYQTSDNFYNKTITLR
jgi:hypothetical protein